MQFKGALHEASMHCAIGVFQMARIWAKATIALIEGLENVPHDHQVAGKALLPWIHAYWVNRYPRLKNTAERDFQLMFWVRFGDPRYKPIFFWNDIEEALVQEWLMHRGTMTSTGSYLNDQWPHGIRPSQCTSVEQAREYALQKAPRLPDSVP